IKILYRKADILILDEPTAVLTPQEVDELFETLKAFSESGKTIILITHKLREPMALCDRISVLRDGKLVGTVDKAKTSPEALAEMMVGRPVVFLVSKTKATPGQTVLSIKDLQVQDDRRLLKVKGINLDMRASEILGIAGVEGNGQQELVEALWGLRKPVSGEIWIGDKQITGFSSRKVHEASVGYIPQDRQRRGLVLDFSIKENLILGGEYQPPFASGPGSLILNEKAIREYSEQLVRNYGIKITDLDDLVNTLSGGNQQKIVVARALGPNPKLLIASHPTRGLDVGATEYIHNLLVKMRDAGVSVLLVSADLDEILNLSDRIAVIFDGKIVAIKSPDETNEKELGLLMAGHQPETGRRK
ncbi:MAG: ABC transporter ATP-binding protein, partial [Promethearchaeota archaeon]